MTKKVSVLTMVGMTLLLLACSPAGREPTAPTPPPTEPLVVTLYFGNTELNPEMLDCGAVFPVERVLPAGSAEFAAEFGLRELFAGPTEAEAAQGYVSWFSEDTADILIGLKVEGTTAYLNLKDLRPIIPNASTSCGSMAFFAEVETTVKQILPIERVIFAIEGDPAPFYEWMQRGCDETNDNCDRTPFADLQ